MTKAELRREVRGRLRAVPPDERAAAGAAIAARVWTVPEVAEARTLLLFASLPDEAPTEAIAAEARGRGMEVAYPRVLPDTRALLLACVPAADRLRAGSYGILEPDDSCRAVAPEEVDAVLVPGLAWDRRGGRLGRGAGYYDRLFGAPGWRGFRCGVFFAVQEVAAVPEEPWDVPLHAVVTEREVWRPTAVRERERTRVRE